MPVGNMVLLSRELLLGANGPLWQVGTVLFSTSLYAAAAVAVAAGVFGKESVVFADAGSLSATFARKLIKPRGTPSISMSLLIVALLFPAWFYVQSAASPGPGEDATRLLRATEILMPPLFVLLPVAVLLYWKTDVRQALSLRAPGVRFAAAAVLIGASAWVPVHELTALQQSVLPLPASVVESLGKLNDAIAKLPALQMLVVLAIMPAVCEELLFRGVLLSGLASSSGRWTAIVVSAAVFGVFHFVLFKFVATAALGVVLGFLCVQSRSIVPGMMVHLLHNGLLVSSLFWPWEEKLGIGAASSTEGPPFSGRTADVLHLPPAVLLGGLAAFGLGLVLSLRPRRA
jgi:ABC-2 type transport system permease protein/sodium transport system permease protein